MVCLKSCKNLIFFFLITASQICWSWVGLAIMPPYTKDKARLIPNSMVRIWIDLDNVLACAVLMPQYDASHLNVYHIIFNLIQSNVGGLYVCKSLLTKYRREPDSFFFPKDEVWGRLNVLVYIYKVELDFYYYFKGCCKVPSVSQDEFLISHIDIISGYF